MRYYFDILSESQQTVDSEGCDLDNESQMRTEAVRLLAEIASEEAPFGDTPMLTARVRDRLGRPVYCAVLSIQGQRLQ